MHHPYMQPVYQGSNLSLTGSMMGPPPPGSGAPQRQASMLSTNSFMNRPMYRNNSIMRGGEPLGSSQPGMFNPHLASRSESLD